jgi:DNA polymerase III delta subunit
MSQLLLVHGDDGFSIDRAIAAFAAGLGATSRSELLPAGSPDEALIDRAGVEAATVGMFDVHLAVLRQPSRAVGRSTSAAERLLKLVRELPEGGALAIADVRASRDAAKPPAIVTKLADAVRDRGGAVQQHLVPRRRELADWIRAHAITIGVKIEPRAAAMLGERLGGDTWETDIERGEQTRTADSELRKLRTHAGERAIGAEDVEALVADTRPASLFAITNAIDRREPAAAARALARALDEGQPVLRIMAALEGRIADMIVARDLLAAHTPPVEMARRIGRGNARAAERIAEAARRYSGQELEAMLIGLWEADLVIKRNDASPESILSAWLGEGLLAARGAATSVRG